MWWPQQREGHSWDMTSCAVTCDYARTCGRWVNNCRCAEADVARRLATLACWRGGAAPRLCITCCKKGSRSGKSDRQATSVTVLTYAQVPPFDVEVDMVFRPDTDPVVRRESGATEPANSPQQRALQYADKVERAAAAPQVESDKTPYRRADCRDRPVQGQHDQVGYPREQSAMPRLRRGRWRGRSCCHIPVLLF